MRLPRAYRNRTRHARRCVAPVALLVVLSGACSTTPPAQTALIASSDIQMSTVELRLRVYGFAEEFANGIIRAADEILASTEDLGVSRSALTWKLNTVTATQVTAFGLDPLAAFYDMWALAIQMRQFFESGPGHGVFGPHHGVAVEAVRHLERRAYVFANSLTRTGRVRDTIRREVEAYAVANPIADLNLVRETATHEFAGEMAADRTSGLAVLGDLNVQVGDLSERIKYYAAGLPEQFRWQSELLLLDILSDDEIVGFLEDITDVGDAAERLAVLGDSLPSLIEAQAAAAIHTVNLEVAASLREVDRQRIATLDALTGERIAVMEGLSGERVAVMADLAAIAEGTLGGMPVPASLEEVVDHAFRRALVLLALMFIGGLVFAVLLRRIWWRPAGS